MISPDELIEELVDAILPLEPTAIVVHEAERDGCNWTINIGPLPAAAKKRYDKEVERLRIKYPKLEWKGVTDFEGKVRLVQKWVTH